MFRKIIFALFVLVVAGCSQVRKSVAVKPFAAGQVIAKPAHANEILLANGFPIKGESPSTVFRLKPDIDIRKKNPAKGYLTGRRVIAKLTKLKGTFPSSRALSPQNTASSQGKAGCVIEFLIFALFLFLAYALSLAGINIPLWVWIAVFAGMVALYFLVLKKR